MQFATCNRVSALDFIRRACKDDSITDTPESAGVLLDFVENDIVRIQDPMMHSGVQVVPGNNWVENDRMRQSIVAACKLFKGE